MSNYSLYLNIFQNKMAEVQLTKTFFTHKTWQTYNQRSIENLNSPKTISYMLNIRIPK